MADEAPASELHQLADTLLGAIPVTGFFLDAVFRANDRNMRLLREHLEEVAR